MSDPFRYRVHCSRLRACTATEGKSRAVLSLCAGALVRCTVGSVNAPMTARAVARRELTKAITTEARRQIARHGADGLSLRAVARELGTVSSALYRYFPSRDDLLTALIVEAYNALGDAIEAADARIDPSEVTERWLAMCRTVRDWARRQPHEYALLYGSPVPGYRAPAVSYTHLTLPTK